MKRRRSYFDYLLDILDNCEKAERFVQGVEPSDFVANDEKVYAVIHALQTIGEAARHLPLAVRQASTTVDWDDIVGMRDIVVHEYFGVDLDILWLSVKKDLPSLAAVVRKMLSDSAGQGDSQVP